MLCSSSIGSCCWALLARQVVLSIQVSLSSKLLALVSTSVQCGSTRSGAANPDPVAEVDDDWVESSI